MAENRKFSLAERLEMQEVMKEVDSVREFKPGVLVVGKIVAQTTNCACGELVGNRGKFCPKCRTISLDIIQFEEVESLEKGSSIFENGEYIFGLGFGDHASIKYKGEK